MYDKYPPTDHWYFTPLLEFSTSERPAEQATLENELVAHKHPLIFTVFH